jgi:hypothetical protein
VAFSGSGHRGRHDRRGDAWRWRIASFPWEQGICQKSLPDNPTNPVNPVSKVLCDSEAFLAIAITSGGMLRDLLATFATEVFAKYL